MIEAQDVVITGGGLAGLSFALQLKQRCPDASICILERNVPPWPVATHKVGESTVEIGAHYFSRTLGLSQHLDDCHLRKFGFRFFHSHGREDIDAVQEIGVSRYLSAPSYQIDRGILENHLLERVREAGVSYVSGARVDAVKLATDATEERGHRVLFRRDRTLEELRARWVVDASGRAGLLKRQLGLAEPNGHDANSVWFRVPVRLDIEDWSRDQGWLNRCQPGHRWRSTNHLVGEGYWVWLIPLSSGYHSVGIVADAARHPFATMNSFDRAMDWLGGHQPRLARALRDSGAAPADFVKLRGFSYDCREVFSRGRWAITGEAGVFLDPFYSPGSDFIAIANTFITDLVARDLGGMTWKPYVGVYEQLFRSFYDSTLLLYRGQYPLFGDPEVLPVKIIWDYAYYWGILCQLFFQERLTDISMLGRTREPLQAARALNETVQPLFRAWSGVSRRENPARLLDQAELGWFAELNHSLRDCLDEDGFVARIGESLDRLRELAAEIVAAIATAYPQARGWPELAAVEALAPPRIRAGPGLLDY